MDDLDESFVLDLRIQFGHEALELIENIESILMDLESSGSTNRVEEMKRDLHCFKGSALAVGFDKFSKIAHDIESICEEANLKAKVDQLLRLLDEIRDAVRNFLSTKDPAGILAFAKGFTK